jgi:hypothetical protein
LTNSCTIQQVGANRQPTTEQVLREVATKQVRTCSGKCPIPRVAASE